MAKVTVTRTKTRTKKTKSNTRKCNICGGKGWYYVKK